MKTGGQQGVRGGAQAGLIGDGHAGEQLRLDAVGLEGVEPAQHRLQLHRLGGGDRVGKDRHRAVLCQIGDALRGNIGVDHQHLAAGQQLLPLREQLGCQMAVDVHVTDRQQHVALLVVDEEISGGVPLRDHRGLGDVDAQFPAAGGDLLGVQVVAEGGDHPHVQAQKAHVVGDVPAHAAQTHPHRTGVGVPVHRHLRRPAADVHVDAAHHRDIGRCMDDVAFAGDVALLHQVGDVHRHGGPGDAGLLRQLLLGDERVFFDPVQNLPFPLGHGAASL